MKRIQVYQNEGLCPILGKIIKKIGRNYLKISLPQEVLGRKSLILNADKF
jgi:hypothetical protein